MGEWGVKRWAAECKQGGAHWRSLALIFMRHRRPQRLLCEAGFKEFWRALSPAQQARHSRERADVILKVGPPVFAYMLAHACTDL